jgi:hypothetical protein
MHIYINKEVTVNGTHTTRIGVLGLYRSGSTALAGILHHLGVDMGAPFYENYYEPLDLSRQLRKWWNEPELTAMTSASKRIAGLKQWIKKRENAGAGCVGAKHPLLSLCGSDLLQAWGTSTRFIRSHRPLDKSVQSLTRLGWWPNKEDFVQTTLWNATANFFATQEHLLVDYEAMLENPEREILRIVDYIGVHPTDGQIINAIQSIRPKKGLHDFMSA